MGICTIGDLESATGTVISEANLGKTQFMIDAISSYIETITGQVFGRVVDCTIRCQADAYGVIEFDDVDDVTAVVLWDTQSPVSGWGYDGMNSIYGLDSNQVVDASISYGWEEPPVDIVSLCVTLVADGLGIPLISGGELQKQRVGDVENTYVTVSSGGVVTVSPDSMMTRVLEKYTRQNRTWRLGPLTFPSTNAFPTM